jgi:nucleoside-diphosphate-sugar epimerase
MHPSPRFLLLSSLAAREPKLSYHAASKHLGEEILKTQGGGLEWVILRPPAVYGPGDREIAPLFKWMCKGLAPQATPREARFSMIYIDDLTEAIAALMAQTKWDGSIFELHDGRTGGYDWGEVVQTVSRVIERPICRFRLPHLLIRSIAVFNLGAARVMGYAPMLSPGKVRELEHKDWTCDNNPIIKATGWHPQTPLGVGIEKTLQYQGLM